MEKNIHIAVIDQEEEMTFCIQESLDKLNLQHFNIQWFKEISNHTFQEFDCIFIDSRLVVDIKQTMQYFKKTEQQKIIFVTDQLNHPFSPAAIFLGANIFYRHSPATAILSKVYKSYGPNTNIPQSIPKEKLNEQLKGKMIAFHSPKGGVGTSTTAVNVAIELAKKNLKVLLVDFSQYGNIGVLFKIVHRGTGLSNLLTAIEQNKVQKEAISLEEIFNQSKHTFTHEETQLDVLISSTPLRMEKIGAREVEELILTVKRFEYDVIVFDTSSELSIRNISLFEWVDEIILHGAPDVSAGWKLIQLKEILDNMNLSQKCKLIINRYTKYLSFSSRELEMELEIPLICVIPEIKEITYLSNQGMPLALNKKHKMNSFYRRIAHHCYPIYSENEITAKKLFFSKRKGISV